MTRKDYVQIARAFEETKPDHPGDAAGNARFYQWRITLDSVIDVLQADNVRFDKGQFLKAAGAESLY